MKLKTVKVPRGYVGVHVETPMGVVNIYTDLRDASGRRVERIEFIANPDYSVAGGNEKRIATDGGIRSFRAIACETEMQAKQLEAGINT